MGMCATLYYNTILVQIWKKISEFLSGHESSTATTSAVVVIEATELLEEDEGEDRVWTQASVVGSEALPQTEDTLVLDQPGQDILLRGIIKSKSQWHYTI